jgi:hypothetical protein
MRQWIAVVAFGALLAMPCPAPAADVEEQIGVEPTEVQPGDVLDPAEKQAAKQRAPKAPAPAAQPSKKLPEDATEDEILDEHMDALRDYERAETDEDAEKAQKRFEDAEARGLKLQRDRLEHAIER